ncbi:hypothetical protein MCEMSEM23_01867 [Rhabdaerophilaceae bacterium]
MNTSTYSEALLPFAGTEGAAQPAKKSLFMRIVDAIAASNAAKAEREIRRFEQAYGRSLRVELNQSLQGDLPLIGTQRESIFPV